MTTTKQRVLALRRQAALDAVMKEWSNQQAQWSETHDQTHSTADWLNILTVFMGKLARETPLFQTPGHFDKQKFKKRLVQVAAIALSAVAVIE